LAVGADRLCTRGESRSYVLLSRRRRERGEHCDSKQKNGDPLEASHGVILYLFLLFVP
jgi:hypothetical protein